MAEYGRIIPPPETKNGLKDLTVAKMYIYILIPVFLLKLIVGIIVGRWYLIQSIILIFLWLPLITIVDSLKGEGKIRVLLKRRGWTIVYKDKEPTYYLVLVIMHYIIILLFILLSFGIYK